MQVGTRLSWRFELVLLGLVLLDEQHSGITIAKKGEWFKSLFMERVDLYVGRFRGKCFPGVYGVDCEGVRGFGPWLVLAQSCLVLCCAVLCMVCFWSLELPRVFLSVCGEVA